MDSHSYYITIIAVLLVLFCLSAFFAVCETAFTSANRIRLKHLAVKNKRARLVLKLLDSYDRLLSSVLIGNTIVNVVSSVLATVLFAGLFGPKGVGLASLVMTVLILIFGEISPKTLAKEDPEAGTLRCAPLMRFFIVLLRPLNYLAEQWKRIIVKVFPAGSNRAVTEDELLTFVEEVRQEGGINEHEEEMIRQAIEFDEITAAEICTPRIDVAAVPQTGTIEEIDRIFAETGFSRLPVYRENIDTIIGVILLKDFHHEVMKGGKSPAEIVKPVVFITKTMKIAKLLQTMQQKQVHMAVLVDEFGGTVGIVTIEDIVEELVGEIWDEDEKAVEPFTHNADGTFTVLGSANVPDMLEFINAKTGKNPPDDTVPAETSQLPNTTVGGWVIENIGELPRAGETFVWRNLRLCVSRVQRQRVMEVIVSRLQEAGL